MADLWQLLADLVCYESQIHMKTMQTSVFRLLTGQDTPHYIWTATTSVCAAVITSDRPHPRSSVIATCFRNQPHVLCGCFKDGQSNVGSMLSADDAVFVSALWNTVKLTTQAMSLIEACSYIPNFLGRCFKNVSFWDRMHIVQNFVVNYVCKMLAWKY